MVFSVATGAVTRRIEGQASARIKGLVVMQMVPMPNPHPVVLSVTSAGTIHFYDVLSADGT